MNKQQLFENIVSKRKNHSLSYGLDTSDMKIPNIC